MANISHDRVIDCHLNVLPQGYLYQQSHGRLMDIQYLKLIVFNMVTMLGESILLILMSNMLQLLFTSCACTISIRSFSPFASVTGDCLRWCQCICLTTGIQFACIFVSWYTQRLKMTVTSTAGCTCTLPVHESSKHCSILIPIHMLCHNFSLLLLSPHGLNEAKRLTLCV